MPLLEYCAISSTIEISTEYRAMLNGWDRFEGAKLRKRRVALFTLDEMFGNHVVSSSGSL